MTSIISQGLTPITATHPSANEALASIPFEIRPTSIHDLVSFQDQHGVIDAIAGHNLLHWTRKDIGRVAGELVQRVRDYQAYTGNSFHTDEHIIAKAHTWLGFSFTIPGETPRQQIGRLVTPAFWKRQLRKMTKQRSEAVLLSAGKVGHNGAMYISETNLKAIKEDKLATELYLKATEAVNQMDGNTVNLYDLRQTNDKKLAEFYHMADAYQALVEEEGLMPLFITTTLESEHHINPKRRTQSEEWSGLTPKESNDILMERFNSSRSEFNRKTGYQQSGFRCTEPHKDGTPHGHFLTAIQPQDFTHLLASLARQFTGGIRVLRTGDDHTVTAVMYDTLDDVVNDNPRPARIIGKTLFEERPNYEKAQVEVTVMNTNISKVVSYVSKYVIKATEDENDRVEAYRKVWTLRGIQWFGVRSSLSPWRNLRRMPEKQLFGLSNDARKLAMAARGTDFKTFITLLGGLAANGKEDTFKFKGWNEATKDRYDGDTTKAIGYRLVNCETGEVENILTRPDKWKLKVDYTLMKAVACLPGFNLETLVGDIKNLVIARYTRKNMYHVSVGDTYYLPEMDQPNHKAKPKSSRKKPKVYRIDQKYIKDSANTPAKPQDGQSFYGSYLLFTQQTSKTAKVNYIKDAWVDDPKTTTLLWDEPEWNMTDKVAT